MEGDIFDKCFSIGFLLPSDPKGEHSSYLTLFAGQNDIDNPFEANKQKTPDTVVYNWSRDS